MLCFRSKPIHLKPTRATRATCAQRRATPAQHLPRNVRAACATSRATRATPAQGPRKWNSFLKLV